MKRKVYVLRHAQTAGKQAGQRDYDRELTAEGERQVNNLGPLMREAAFIPELILSSSSARTRQTTELLQSTLQIPTSQIHYLDSLYEAPTTTWIQQLKEIPDDINSLLLVGHNPAISHLASIFGGNSIDLSACGFIAFEFIPTAWREFPIVGKELTRKLSPT